MTDQVELRVMNGDGIRQFRELIDDLHSNPGMNVDLSWIYENRWSDSIESGVLVEKREFKQKLEAARYLMRTLYKVELVNKYFHQGLWAWLSAYYFDSVCPVDDRGERKPGKPYRHIPPADRYWRTIYRHLLAGPIRLYEMHGEAIKFLLRSDISKHGDFLEQLASRQEIAASKGILEAAGLLYWDQNTNKPKVGARSKDREPGTLRRYVDVLQQLMLTYDLYSMDGVAILRLLPQKEFGSWMPEDIRSQLKSED